MKQRNKKSAIVMGATSGIGYEVAMVLAQRGWNVAVAGRREHILADMTAQTDGIEAYEVIDVTDPHATDALHRLIDKMDGINLYFHSSGIGYQNTQLDADRELDTINTNCLGMARLVGEAFRYFESHPETDGQIAVISSIARTKGLGAAPAYSASKRFTSHYLESLCQLTSIKGIRNIHITDIRPGFVKTPLIEGSHFPMQLDAPTVAAGIVRAVERKRPVVTINWLYRLLVFFWQLIPRWLWVRMKIISTVLLLTVCTITGVNAQSPEWGKWTSWGDMGDGTYHNPIIPADFSDIDCIKVGNDYYAISSTMQFSPGMVVLHSRDLVNWEICSHVVSDLTQISAELDWNRMNRYGRGVWAGSIRWHRGRFYVVFGTPDEGYFISSAKKAEGPWTPLRCLLAEKGWDDCCIDWDEKGQPWFVGTCFKDGYSTYMMKMSKNMKTLDMASRVLVNKGMHREANKLIRHDGWYYLVYSEHTNEEGRYVMAKRSRKIEGPYSEAHRLTWNTPGDNEPNQGGIVEGPDGKWYFLTHHGRGSWEGRDVSLLPVTWKDGWPEIGRMTWSGAMPAESTAGSRGSFVEDFNGRQLDANLEWNYQPRKEKLSLTERKGFLRMKAFKPLKPNDFMKTGNILTWRIWRSGNMTSTVKIDPTGISEGTHCGLCVFSPTSSSIGITMSDGKRWIVLFTKNKEVCRKPLDGKQVFLRCTAHQNGYATFCYSTDSMRYQPLGTSYPMQWGNYRGARMGIFCYNENAESGYADFDYIHTETDKPENVFGHALVPDMIADASIIDVDGTFYCYATTDGYGRGLQTSGPPVVWKSKDFVNWSFDGTYFPQAENEKYWAPSKAVRSDDGKWYIYPTVNGYMYPAVADSPDGPFRLVKGNTFELQNRLWEKDKVHAIDTEIFIDDDGSRYAFWGSRNVARLNADMATIDTTASTAHGTLPLINTRRKEYSEGPIFFKRKGIYYYLYTIGGDERYEYYYQMSRESPLGPYVTPENDLVCTTNVGNGVFGPGHGCVFNVEGTDDYYLAFLEFGRNSTNRQTYVNKLQFNDDGTIRQVEVTLNGTGALRPQPPCQHLTPKAVMASSVHAPMNIRHFKDDRCQRTEHFVPEFAVDGANGSRWMAETTDSTACWLMLDLGAPTPVSTSSIAFVRPTAGHAYSLEGSVDGTTWVKCGGHNDTRKMSPHTDNVNAAFRYLRVTILDGVKGIWEWKVEAKN